MSGSATEYLEKHNVQKILADAVAATLKARPEDPLSFIGQLLADAKEPEIFTKLWPSYMTKMTNDGCNEAAINAFKYNFKVLCSGASLMIPGSDIKPVESLPTYESLTAENKDLLRECVMLKLNGGLGTGMGLAKAKSLLPLSSIGTEHQKCFLDFIALQVKNMRDVTGVDLAFMLMDSFSTSADTLAHLAKYPDLATNGLPLDFNQNKAPKITKSDKTPALWPAEPDHEWCPPGHGDVYPALLGSKTLDLLLSKGYKYMFVSNSDNLGATMDLKLLTWFAGEGKPFAMECASRTEADKKGGHLAADAKTGNLLLRESAQCPPDNEAEEKEFQNTDKFKFFNTNNLWINLVQLKAAFEKHGGALPLPVMENGKTVDPRDKKSTKVLQLETAMGAAISCFDGAGAILIPRSRFAPVKTTGDMLSLMSDAYEVTTDHRMVLKAEREGIPPLVKIDGYSIKEGKETVFPNKDKDCYKFVDAMIRIVGGEFDGEAMTKAPSSIPSLVKCKQLTVAGKNITFAPGVIFEGEVKVSNPSGESKTLAAGTYSADVSL